MHGIYHILTHSFLIVFSRRSKARKAASQYPVSFAAEINAAFGDGSNGSQNTTSNNRQFHKNSKEKRRRSTVFGYDADYDDDSGHGTTEDYDNIHIDVIETNVDGMYAQPQKSTLKRKGAENNNVTVVSTLDKKVNFSEDIYTIVDDEGPSEEQPQELSSDQT